MLNRVASALGRRIELHAVPKQAASVASKPASDKIRDIDREPEPLCRTSPSTHTSSKKDEDARRNIRDAVRGFLATSADMGTLGEILEEAGYRRDGDDWRAPEFVSLDRLTMSIK